MTKKRTSILTLAASLVLAMTLCLSMALPVGAYSQAKSPTEPAEAAITKRLRMPVNTPTPNATFTFVFTAKGIDDGADTTNMPTITDKTVQFPAADASTFTDGGDTYLVKETANFVPTGWKSAGIYKYQVEEKQEGITLTGAVNEGEAYSKARYDIEIWVEADGNGGFYAKFVNAKIVTGYVDEYYDGYTGNGKVDPTPGGSNPKEEATIEDNFSQVMFTNRYWRSDGGGTDKPGETALEIIKAVAGNGAEKDKYFDFTVKVTKPDAVTGAQTYKACVLDEAGDNVTTTDNYPTLSGKFIEFPSGTALTAIKLKDGQRLAFVNLHVGSAVEAEETGATGYKPSYERTFGKPGVFTAPAANTTWGFPRTPDDPAPHYTKAGKNANIATFTNDRSGATPTGISVDNLPYFALIGVLLVALAGFVVFKSRRRASNNA